MMDAEALRWLAVAAPAAAMTYAAAADLGRREIPDAVPIGLAAGFLLAGPLAGVGWTALGLHALTALAVLALGVALFASGVMGGADGKLAAAAALWLGPAATPHFLALAAILGGVLALAVLAFRAAPLPRGLRRRRWARLLRSRRVGLPYGVALAGAAIATLSRTDWLVAA